MRRLVVLLLLVVPAAVGWAPSPIGEGDPSAGSGPADQPPAMVAAGVELLRGSSCWTSGDGGTCSCGGVPDPASAPPVPVGPVGVVVIELQGPAPDSAGAEVWLPTAGDDGGTPPAPVTVTVEAAHLVLRVPGGLAVDDALLHVTGWWPQGDAAAWGRLTT